MILKNSDFKSFDEIKAAIPAYWKQFDDYMALQKFVADEMDNINDSAMLILNSAFILKLDLDTEFGMQTIEAIEKFLKIYDIAERVVIRSVYVNSVLTSIGKLSVSKLKAWIKTVLNQEPQIEFVEDTDHNRILTFEFEDMSAGIPETMALIAGRLPAGMIVEYINRFQVDAPNMNMAGYIVIQTEGTVIQAAHEYDTGFEL